MKMSAGDAKATTDVLFGCTDVPGMMKKAMNSSGQVPAAMQDCVNKTLNESRCAACSRTSSRATRRQAKQGPDPADDEVRQPERRLTRPASR